MTDTLFSASTIPALEQVVSFTQNRHAVLASNIANLSTPGYRARDLSPALFESRLKEAIQTQREARTAPAHPSQVYAESQYPVDGGFPAEPLQPEADFQEVREAAQSILYHDDSNVGIENQVAEIGKNQTKHNTALAIMVSQFRLLQAAISERP